MSSNVLDNMAGLDEIVCTSPARVQRSRCCGCRYIAVVDLAGRCIEVSDDSQDTKLGGSIYLGPYRLGFT